MATTKSMTSQGLASVACLACRAKHAKCNSCQPCSRCVTEGISCQYVASNRGFRRPAKRQRSNDSVQLSLHASTTDSTTVLDPACSAAELTPADGLGSSGFSQPIISTASSCPFAEPSSALLGNDSCPNDYFIALYFRFFHKSHPILLPPQCQSPETWTPLLRMVTSLIGSRYSDSSPGLNGSQIDIILTSKPPATIELAQAQLLYTIFLHATGHMAAADARLKEAVATSLALQLHDDLICRQLAGEDPLQLESLRRTWWELYIVDTMLAALHQRAFLRTGTLVATSALPCEESLFHGGDVTSAPARTPEELQTRTLSASEVHFSSFAYRIETAMLLARVVGSTLDADRHRGEDIAQGIDAILSSWVATLPPDKFDVVDSDGSVDEMLFQARMLVCSATLYMHLPRSTLTHSVPPLAHDNLCARRVAQAAPLDTRQGHAVRALAAATQVSMLAAAASPITARTPFFICSLVLAAIAHVSSCMGITSCARQQPRRDRVIQAVGLLRSYARVWPLAAEVMEQVRAAAAQTFAGPRSTDIEASTDIATEQDSGFYTADGGLASWSPDETDWLEQLLQSDGNT